MSASLVRDPRVVLVREKYFNLRPQPLERWLWQQGVSPSAERVFWLHWQEGMRNQDWCSELPLKYVASLCCLDVSTVTRCYQQLAKLGLVRRENPGRDPANPFQQATAITEVRVPRELLVELDRYPSRPPSAMHRHSAVPVVETAPTAVASAAVDPFTGLSGRERVRAIGALRAALSPAERSRYDEALSHHRSHFEFDIQTTLTPEQRGSLLALLGLLAARPVADPRPLVVAAFSGPRRLSVFELARLRREVVGLVASNEVPETLRQLVWSIEEGALRRFGTLHAMRIALKKIREGAWSRPHRMPPNWARVLASRRGG